MSQLTFTNVFFEDAKEILSLAYQLDKSSSYVNDFCVNGSAINANISVNETASAASTVKKFDVSVASDVFEYSTMKDHFNEYAFAL